jgi:hypothetical protein
MCSYDGWALQVMVSSDLHFHANEKYIKPKVIGDLSHKLVVLIMLDI